MAQVRRSTNDRGFRRPTDIARLDRRVGATSRTDQLHLRREPEVRTTFLDLIVDAKHREIQRIADRSIPALNPKARRSERLKRPAISTTRENIGILSRSGKRPERRRRQQQEMFTIFR